MNNPTAFKPKSIHDFIGPARLTAEILNKLVARSAPVGEPIKALFHGDPGVGKSALVDYLLAKLGCDQWSVTKLNGTQLTIERLEQWASTLCYRELSGGYKVLRIEEMDKASAQAQVRLLTVMDDLPKHVAIVGTSNRKVEDMEKRLVSRFQAFALTGPPQAELRRFLTQWPLTPQALDRISTFACGNVRLALFEAQTALDTAI
jgi:replication-associated recombination protein RarA